MFSFYYTRWPVLVVVLTSETLNLAAIPPLGKRGVAVVNVYPVGRWIINSKGSLVPRVPPVEMSVL